MILQALKEYYDRKAADPDSGIAPEGWIQGGIDFVIELDFDGTFLGIQSLQEQDGNKMPQGQCSCRISGNKQSSMQIAVRTQIYYGIILPSFSVSETKGIFGWKA